MSPWNVYGKCKWAHTVNRSQVQSTRINCRLHVRAQPLFISYHRTIRSRIIRAKPTQSDDGEDKKLNLLMTNERIVVGSPANVEMNRFSQGWSFGRLPTTLDIALNRPRSNLTFDARQPHHGRVFRSGSRGAFPKLFTPKDGNHVEGESNSQDPESRPCRSDSG